MPILVGQARKHVFNRPSPLFVYDNLGFSENLDDFMLILINSIKLGLNFDQGGTNSAMTNFMVLSATMGKNERFEYVVMVASTHW
jgi:hypothetical protein